MYVDDDDYYCDDDDYEGWGFVQEEELASTSSW